MPVTSNYRCKFGEIDLIMINTNTGVLAFIEVKYRHSSDFGHALQTVTKAKQHRIRVTAAHFLNRNPQLAELVSRFDVVGVSPGKAIADAQIEWLPGAFY